MNKAAQYVKDIFFPPRCVFCDRVIAPVERPFCPACAARTLPRIQPEICSRCGRGKAYCSCRGSNLYTDGIAAPFYYEETVKSAVLLYKRVEDTDRTAYFAAEMTECAYRAFPDKTVEYLTTVPMHRRELRRRGFDQTQPLAKRLSRELHVPYRRLLQKCVDTVPQKTLNAEQRRSNLLGAFDLCPGVSLTGKTVLLIDDVVTTGATVSECAKMLKIYGAKAVYVLAIALTRQKNTQTEERQE